MVYLSLVTIALLSGNIVLAIVLLLRRRRTVEMAGIDLDERVANILSEALKNTTGQITLTDKDDKVLKLRVHRSTKIDLPEGAAVHPIGSLPTPFEAHNSLHLAGPNGKCIFCGTQGPTE